MTVACVFLSIISLLCANSLIGGGRSMQELVGTCSTCGKTIYCREGFLDGVVLEDKSLVCFECLELSKPREQ